MKKTKISIIILCVLTFLSNSVISVANSSISLKNSENSHIYLSNAGSSTSSGTSPHTAVNDFELALSKVANGGNIIVLDVVTVNAKYKENTAVIDPDGVPINKNVTIESDGNGNLTFRGGISLYGNVIFKNIKLNFSSVDGDGRNIYVNGNSLNMDNVTIPETTSEGFEIKNFPTIYGGGLSNPNKNGVINVNSGTYENIYCGSNGTDYTGNVTVNFQKTAKVKNIVGAKHSIYVSKDGKPLNGDVFITISNNSNTLPILDGGVGNGSRNLALDSWCKFNKISLELRGFTNINLLNDTHLVVDPILLTFQNIENMDIGANCTLELKNTTSIAGNLRCYGLLSLDVTSQFNILGTATGNGKFAIINNDNPQVKTYITSKGGDCQFSYAQTNKLSTKGDAFTKTPGTPTVWAITQYNRQLTDTNFSGLTDIDISTTSVDQRAFGVELVDQYRNLFRIPTIFTVAESVYQNAITFAQNGISTATMTIGTNIKLPATVTICATGEQDGIRVNATKTVNITRSEKLIQLQSPTNLRWVQERKIAWTTVANAHYYIVSIFQSGHNESLSTSYERAISGEQYYTIPPSVALDSNKSYYFTVVSYNTDTSKYQDSEPACSGIYGTFYGCVVAVAYSGNVLADIAIVENIEYTESNKQITFENVANGLISGLDANLNYTYRWFAWDSLKNMQPLL